MKKPLKEKDLEQLIKNQFDSAPSDQTMEILKIIARAVEKAHNIQ